MQESLINNHLVRQPSLKRMKQWQAKFLKWKTCVFTPIYGSSLIVVLLIFGQQASSLWISFLTHQAHQKINQALTIQSEEENLLKDFLREEEAILTTVNHQANAVFDDHLNRLHNYLEDQPQHLQKLDKIKFIYDSLQVALPISYATKNTYVGELSAEINNLIELQDQLIFEYKNWLQQLDNINTNINVISTILILLGVSLHIWFLHERIQIPLRKLTTMGKMWRDENLEPQFCSATAEISDLAQVIKDITKEASDRQQQAQVKNQQLEEMILALSHDLRTPLIATRSTIDGMLKGAFGPINDNWQELFEDYRQANEDLLKLIERLLDISRYENGQKNHLNSDQLCWQKIFDKVISLVKVNDHQKTLNYQYHISPDLPKVYGDELEIQRVVQNLVDNAARASEPNQEIFLDVTTFGDTEVKVAVRDQGVGIAPKDQEKLFHRFIQGQSRRGRSGLGLYLCRQIIEAHSGTICVESSLGKGSTFWFTLPATTSKTVDQSENNLWNKK
ncbi:sensor histidine kinase [Aliinostoc sp. HNIBRCY26]|uniref:sensor histidine kinase n=1 Tax=Aliinostoc sp. HNIBRCY26 TaxID=3418997 RepID=UPI003D047781